MGVPRAEAMINVEDASRMLGVHTVTLYKWRSRGVGPKSYRVGGAVRYRPSEINDWLQRNATEAGALTRAGGLA